MSKSHSIDSRDWNRLMTLTRLRDKGMLDCDAVIGRLRREHSRTLGRAIASHSEASLSPDDLAAVQLLRRVTGLPALGEVAQAK
ncbi:MAG: hypothetical protein H6742_22100 [Alphaproteobacteria bacterium]|nr:hypothetical protein [Alphaproteobacteria bacterium]